MEEKLRTVPPQLPTQSALTEQEVGEERREEESQKLGHTLIHAHSVLDL